METPHFVPTSLRSASRDFTEAKRPDNGAEAMETNPLSDTFSGRTAIGAAPWKRSIRVSLRSVKCFHCISNRSNAIVTLSKQNKTKDETKERFMRSERPDFVPLSRANRSTCGSAQKRGRFYDNVLPWRRPNIGSNRYRSVLVETEYKMASSLCE